MSGEVKNKIDKVIFTAVDSKYFKKYAYAWAWSIYKNNMHGHIHVIDPSNQDLNNLKKLQKNSKDRIRFSTGYSDFNFPRDRCFFASFRFLYADKLNNLYNKVLITDVDSIIRREFEFPSEDFGFYVRKPIESDDTWYVESSKLAAGIFYINLDAAKKFKFTENYLDSLIDLKKNNQWKWMVDQNALYKVFHKLTELDRFKIKKFGKKDLCWDFNDSSQIWTGKGARKYKSKKYIQEFKKYLHDYYKVGKISFLERVLNFINQV